MKRNKVTDMKVIGLTGGTGSGKGAVSDYLKEKGVYIVDTDKIAHDIILKGNEAYDELVAYFGNEIVGEDGEIVRRRLGTIVFAEGGEKLDFLNKCTHKHIYNEMERQIKLAEKEGYKAALLDAPLLIEGNFMNLCDEVWAVYTEQSVREDRIMARDGITREQAKDRISKQKDWKIYESFADVVLDNSTDLDSIRKQAEDALNKSLGVTNGN